MDIVHFSEDNLIGAGVSIFDFNKDGLNDLTLSTGYRFPISFYKNTGDGFEQVDLRIDCICEAKQILWVDYDNDDDYDLFISCFGDYNRLYEDEGDFTFRDVTIWTGLSLDIHKGYGAAFGDFNRDGWLDLYYNSRQADDIFSERNSSYLYINNQDKTFTNISRQAKAADEGKIPFCSVFFDYNNDNWPDIYTAQDKLQLNTLLKNNGDGTFSDVGEITNSNERMNAMCTTVGDFNKDGLMDIYVTNTPKGNRLLVNQGLVDEEFQFSEQAEALGVSYYGWAWASQFFDADNDNDLDLYVSGALFGEPRVTSALYEQNEDGLFDHLSKESMLGDTVNSHTNAVGDINNDGKLDIVVHNNDPYPFHIWINESINDYRWLKLDLKGVLSNKDAIGAKVELYTEDDYQLHQTFCGYGFLGQNPHELHIGLGSSELVDSLLITWPTGHQDIVYDIQSNQMIKLYEGQTTNDIISIDADIEEFYENIQTATSEQILGRFQVFISPNPSSEWVTITTDDLFDRIQLLNTNGSILKDESVLTSTHSFDIQNLSPGTYFVRIFRNSKVVTQKIAVLPF